MWPLSLLTPVDRDLMMKINVDGTANVVNAALEANFAM